jgi:peptidoglycan/LPS O-acetylase OafA/YrhL
MAPGDLITTSQDAVAQLFMGANIQFWRTADYFGPHAEFRPLLHCWSLAVEEQFYLLLPLLLVVAWPASRRRVAIVLVLGSLVSLGLSVATLDRHPWATFYLLPTRAWELALGSLLALRGVVDRPGGVARESIAAIGLAAMIVPAFVYSPSTPFPGLAALPVCLGTAILIATPGTRISRVLSTPLLRAIGVTSYSLYLWHWPILALMRYVEGPELSVEQTVWALVGTAAIGTASWRFVEQPFRRAGSRIGVGTAFGSAAIATACGLLMAGTLIAMRGVPGRFSAEESIYVRQTGFDRTWIGDHPRGIGAIDREDQVSAYLLIGDSHAAAVGPAFDAAARDRGILGHAAFKMGNLPFPSDRYATHPEWTERMIEWAIEHHVPRVLLCARWSRYVEIALEKHCYAGDSSTCLERIVGDFVDHLDGLATRLDDHGIDLWVLLEVPRAPHPVHAGVRSRLLDVPLPTRGVTLDSHLAHQRNVRSIMSALASRPVRLYDLAEPFFPGSEEAAVYRDHEGVFYKDDNHLSVHGARRLMADHVGHLLDIAISEPPTGTAQSRRGPPGR